MMHEMRGTDSGGTPAAAVAIIRRTSSTGAGDQYTPPVSFGLTFAPCTDATHKVGSRRSATRLAAAQTNCASSPTCTSANGRRAHTSRRYASVVPATHGKPPPLYRYMYANSW